MAFFCSTVGGQPTNQPIPVTNEANILWVIQSREDFKKVLSNYLSTQADHDNGVKKIGGFDFKVRILLLANTQH